VALWLGSWYVGRVLFAPLVFDTLWAWFLIPTWLVVRVGCHLRAFAVMHDATHGALFSRAWANEMASVVAGLLILIDGPDWRHSHRQHHAVEGMEVSNKIR
jgi:fatty acid desaturase